MGWGCVREGEEVRDLRFSLLSLMRCVFVLWYHSLPVYRHFFVGHRLLKCSLFTSLYPPILLFTHYATLCYHLQSFSLLSNSFFVSLSIHLDPPIRTVPYRIYFLICIWFWIGVFHSFHSYYICTVYYFRSALFWDVTQRRVVVLYRRFGTTYLPRLEASISQFFLDVWTLEDGTHMLSRNVATELPVDAA